MVATLENPTRKINGNTPISQKELVKKLKKMRVKSSKQVAKYELMLKKLKARLELSEDLALTQFMKENHISSKAGQVLKDGGVIRRTGRSSYEWVAPIEPNRYMAQELIHRMRKKKFDPEMSVSDSAVERARINEELEEVDKKYNTTAAATATETKVETKEEEISQEEILDFDVEEPTMLPQLMQENPQFRELMEKIRSNTKPEPTKKTTTVRIPLLWGLFSLKYEKTIVNE